MLLTTIFAPVRLAAPLGFALVIACAEEHAVPAPAPYKAPPAVIELHPLVALEAALLDPGTTRAEFWRLGTEVLGWDVVATGDPEAIEVEELRAWIAEDLRLSGIGDWPYETLYANHRGPAAAGSAQVRAE